MESVEHMVNIQEQRLTGLLAAFNKQKENLLQTSRRDKGKDKGWFLGLRIVNKEWFLGPLKGTVQEK